MSESTIYYRFVCRRDTAANWVIHGDDVLKEGEWGVETDTNKAKLGDGLTPYRALPYVITGTIDLANIADGSMMYWDAARNTWAMLNTDLRTAVIGAKFDNGTDTIEVGKVCDVYVPFGFTILEWRVLCESSADVFEVDVYIGAYAAHPLTNTNAITGTLKPKIVTPGTTKNADSALTGWSKTHVAGQTVRFEVLTAANVNAALVELIVRKS